LTVSGAGIQGNPTVLLYSNPKPNNASRCGPSYPQGTSCVQLHYTLYTVQTNFGCPAPGVLEYPATAVNLVSSISLPDSTSYTFPYEGTPGHPGNVTGRLASVTLPTGGTINYSYTGGNQGITCSDGAPATLSRKTPDTTAASKPDWKYEHKETG